MIYRVEMSPRAVAEADAAYEAIAEWSVDAAVGWVEALTLAAASLDRMPRRHGYAREHGRVSYELRQFRQAPYRVLFTITGNTVRILHVRHQAMDDIPARELGR